MQVAKSARSYKSKPWSGDRPPPDLVAQSRHILCLLPSHCGVLTASLQSRTGAIVYILEGSDFHLAESSRQGVMTGELLHVEGLLVLLRMSQLPEEIPGNEVVRTRYRGNYS